MPSVLRVPPERYTQVNENYPSSLIERRVRRPTISSERFKGQLREAGVHVEQITTSGVPHGYLNNVGLCAAKASMDRMAYRLTDHAPLLESSEPSLDGRTPIARPSWCCQLVTRRT